MKRTDALTQAGLNLIQQALTIYDSDLKLAVCNRRFAEMFDLPDDYVRPGATFQDTIRHLAEHGEYGKIEDIDAFVRERTEVALAFEPHYMERPRANGRTISVEGAPLPQGGWVTVYTDITNEKAQEQLLRTRSELLSEEVLARSEELSATNRQLAATISALEETRRQLTEMEARTRLTTEMMPAHIAHVDANGYYTYSNRRLSSVIPGRPSNIIGEHISRALGPDTFAKVRPHLETAFDGTQSTFEFTDAESARRIRVVFTPDQDEQGVYILSLDVTEETQARVALQQTRRREIAAQLTSGLAHDFSNLLTIILGTQSKLSRMELGDTADTLIKATLNAAKRGGTLLNRIADMTGARAYRPEPVDLPTWLSEFETLATSTLPHGVTLEITNTVAEPLLLDPGMLQDGLLNLILNARDACSPNGSISLTVSEIIETWVQFTVEDTGTGFSEEAMAHALNPFFTTKGAEGSGLGLAMVYDMAKVAGGQIQLENGTKGARVSLRLPIRHADTMPESNLILLVEDDPNLRMGVRDMLTDLGHSVIEATSVEEAALLAKGLPEINFVLSDIVLEQEAPGVDLLHRLPDCDVRLMTSLPINHPLHQAAIAHGPVLTKPFSAPQLAGFLATPKESS